jgi:hypothetical protein
MLVVRRARTWLVALPVIVIGSQVAHGIAYWWAYPVASVRLAILQHSGHGYLGYAPIVLSLLAAIELLVLVVAVVDRVRERPTRSLPAWAFMWIPAVGFTLQEYLERFITSGVFPLWTFEQPTFGRGLVLQLPLGLLAYAIARLLLRTADVVAAAIRARRDAGPRLRAPSTALRPLRSALLPRPAPLALAAAGRAPPPRSH